ncbi:MAG TPA: DUF6599 family protein [Syntrophorhabdales bacterium]|nr:DUF6599 family protein [Syntrophorhabdales bacterium]
MTNRMMRSLLILTAVLSIVSPLRAAEKALENVLPADCVAGWSMDGKVATYNPENLYKYIDGEAELYMPYGFRKAATVMYAKPGDKDIGIVVNVFEMGSLLDAFGIYANYRTPALKQAKAGAEGFLDESQLMFYQDRYFIQIEASGALTEGGPLFRSCAEAISRNLPDSKQKPRELDFLNVPEAVPLTERYYASGLLGHSFFGRGFTGEVMIGKEQAKSVVMLGESEEAASGIFTEYGKYLKESKAVPQVSIDKGGTALHVIDPLYKGVVLQQSGKYVVGVVGLKDPHEGDAIVAQLLKRLPNR